MKINIEIHGKQFLRNNFDQGSPSNVKLINVIEYILSQLHISCSWAASLIHVSRDVSPDALDGTEAVSRDDFFSSLSLNDFHTLVICIWACVGPIPPPIKDFSAPRVCANAFVTP